MSAPCPFPTPFKLDYSEATGEWIVKDGKKKLFYIGEYENAAWLCATLNRASKKAKK